MPDPDQIPARPQPEKPTDPNEEQTGIIPGRIPGQPKAPHDPRFPGSQPDLA